MVPSKILIVDDEKSIRDQITRWLNSEGYKTEEAETGEETFGKLKASNFSVVLLDLKLPDMNGLKVLSQIRKDYPDICVIIFTAHGNTDVIKKALRAGAYDFFDKPIRYGSVLPRIESAIERFNTAREHYYQTEEEQQKYTFQQIIGNSPKIKETLELIKKVAPTEATVLISGESGTGKELVAKAIHFNSPRCNKPLVVADCSTITPTLIESELFGHEKGAFTGATERRIGKFERAHGSTLFIDEIGELSKELQMKLLRFLQEGTIERVGGLEVIQIDTRIVAATAVDLKNAIEQNRFREDLYYRLNVVNIHLSPLRDHKEDILLLVDHFIKKYGRKNLKEVKSISQAALRRLQNYDFPGNVRELENIVQRAVVLTTNSEIKPQAIMIDTVNTDSRFIKQYIDLPLKEFANSCERDYLIHHLNKLDWHLTNVSKEIRIDRTNLNKKMKKHKLSKR